MNTVVVESNQKAEACMIWMHGLGASADDMAGLAKQLPLNVPVRHVALNAPIRPVTLNQGMPMPAWYDITGVSLTDREDKVGIVASEQKILQIIEAQIADGFAPQNIFLAGFSQGGAMALLTALRTDIALGGVISLSAYLPLASECHAKLPKKTPIFIGSGQFDPMVLPAWTAKSVTWLREAGFHALTVREYPMEHSVCIEEVQEIAVWFKEQMALSASIAGDVA
ncbi:MAG: carboxylesterase [Legionellaceae bacterium]|nr:carboxylesterase [Legionellaceae bacterium]